MPTPMLLCGPPEEGCPGSEPSQLADRPSCCPNWPCTPGMAGGSCVYVCCMISWCRPACEVGGVAGRWLY